MRTTYLLGAIIVSTVALSNQSYAGQFDGSNAITSHIQSLKIDVQHRRKERDRDRDRDEGEVRCGDAISVAGAARITNNWARSLAIKAWKEQVRFRYGEEFMNYDRARVVKDQCEASSFGGSMKRCRIVARPCKETF